MFPSSTKILVCDDMLTMRKVVKKVLGELGFKEITEAKDGVAGWVEVEKAVAAGAPFQLIVSDWNMPNLTGLDLLKKVRGTPAIKTTPFVLCTAEGEASQIQEAIAAGVDGYVMKPFSAPILTDKLTAVWKKYHP